MKIWGLSLVPKLRLGNVPVSEALASFLPKGFRFSDSKKGRVISNEEMGK